MNQSLVRQLFRPLVYIFLYFVPVIVVGQQKGISAAVKADSTSRGSAIVSDSVHDSLNVAVTIGDSVPKKYQPVPKKSGLYSAVLPGLGQVYNHQAWKVPIIYTAFAVAGYFFITDLNNYNLYRKAYIGRINNPYPNDQFVNIYTEAQLQQLQADYEKYLDMTVLYSIVGYGLQVMDAISSAHLKNFDISRDISMKIRPVVLPGYVGIGLVFRDKYNHG